MSVLVTGLALFVFAFLLHILVWRVRKPAKTFKALIAVFNFTLISGVLGLIILAYALPGQAKFPRDLSSYIYISIFFESLFLFYLFSYPAIEADSPSLLIVLRIARAGSQGLPQEKISQLLKDELLVEPRLKDLVEAQLVDLSGSKYRINRKGRLFITPFIIYRTILGLGSGG